MKARPSPRRLAGLLVALVLAGCMAASPAAAVQDFFRAVDRGDTDAIKASVSSSLLAFQGGKLERWITTLIQSTAAMGGIKTVEVMSEQTTGDFTTLKVKVVYGNGQEKIDSMDLVREKGRWKVAG